MTTKDTLLLAVAADFSVKIGVPPTGFSDAFNKRSETFAKLDNLSRVACSPDVELFCILGGDLYRGPMPSNTDVDWFSVARRVGRSEWSKFKLIFFHPNGELYATTNDGDFYKGPKPDNEKEPWMTQQAKKIGSKSWNEYEAMFFDNEGILYAVSDKDKFYKGAPPSDENVSWVDSTTLIGNSNWCRLTHFMGIAPDKKLWCVDKYNGNLYRGDLPATEHAGYITQAQYLGWGYHQFKFLSFIKDKTICDILSFDFLVDKGEKVSQVNQLLAEKIYDNRGNSSPLKDTFSFQETIKESSTFIHEHGFTFKLGAEFSFKTGIPVTSKESANVTLNMNTTHNWSLTESNETEVTFDSSSPIEVEAGKAIRMEGSVLKAEINVPYEARVLTLFGSEVVIMGMWKGVSYFNLMVRQEDYDK